MAAGGATCGDLSQVITVMLSGLPAAFAALAAVAAAATVAAMKLWPARDPNVVPHVLTDLDPGHRHIEGAVPAGCHLRHEHAFVLDQDHAS